MRAVRNPVVQFVVAALVLLAAVAWLTGVMSGRAARSEAILDARQTTVLLARSVAEPALPRRFATRDAGAVDRFDRVVQERVLSSDVRRVKVWRADGTIVYSDETRLIGEHFTLGDEEQEILAEGGSEAEVADLTKPENRYEPHTAGGLVEVYTQVRTPEGEPLLFEAYYSAADIAARQQRVFSAFRPITLTGLVVLGLVAVGLLWALTRRLDRASRARERLLLSAVEASDAERRRIARDLHDGVVQDLAGTSFALSALARDPGTGTRVVERLNPANDGLRRNLRSLRSLLVEIYPPDLEADGLAAALEDLVAPAAGAGVEATVSVDGVEGVPADRVALVWRTAQEAVRNALRHARSRHLEVEVARERDCLTLRVHDDGVGFVPGAFRGEGGLGLRALRDLVAEAGGSLDVDSGPGRGTTVRMSVAAR